MLTVRLCPLRTSFSARPLQFALRIRYPAQMRTPAHSLTGRLDAVDSHLFAPLGAGDDDGFGPGKGGDDEGELGLAIKARAKPKKPSQYKVLLMNDDYTPMEFVIIVLRRFFRMDIEQATRVMLHVHQRGVGVCGIFPLEVAETKVNQVMDYARENQHPLQCTLEKA